MNDKLQELIEKVLNSRTLVEAKQHVKEIQKSLEVPEPEAETSEYESEEDYESSYESSYDDDYESSY